MRAHVPVRLSVTAFAFSYSSLLSYSKRNPLKHKRLFHFSPVITHPDSFTPEKTQKVIDSDSLGRTVWMTVIGYTVKF